ncbi:MAG: hypothetical protein IJ757_04165 [Clostridiales bacterium]|nr:hypothetical protein [Clostridiales bacterium]
MEDSFYERCVKRDQGAMGKLFPVLSIIALVIFAVFLNGIPILLGYNIIYFTGMVTFGLSYLLYRLIKSLNVEYQIEITNDSVEVTKITNKKKVEQLAEFSIKECEYIGAVTSDRFNDDIAKADYSLNCTSLREYDISDNVWYICLTQDKIRYNVIIDFDPEMYPIFRRYNPRGTMRYDA